MKANGVRIVCEKLRKQLGIKKPLSRMCCDTRLPHTCWTRAPICAASNFCSATAIWRLPRDISTSPKPACTLPQARSTICPSRYPEPLREGTELHERTSARSGRCLPRSRERVPSALGPCSVRTSSGRCCAISACAARRRWALIWNDAIAAVMRRSLTTHAATGTVPSVSPRHAIAGSSSRLEVCCRCPTPMWSSPYPNNWRRSHCATRSSSTPCCFARLPRRCSRSLPIRAISVRVSVCWPCCTPGRRTCRHHPHLHCLVPAGGLALDNSRWIATRRRGFFLPGARRSAACSAASCSPSSSRATGAANYASPASWLNYQHHAHFTLCLGACAGESGWSTPSLRSEDPNMC